MSISARTAAGSIVTAAVVVLSAIVLALTATVQSAVSLLAGTALIVPGTGTKDPTLSENYTKNAVNYFIAPATGVVLPCATDAACNAEPVPYLAQFWPFPFDGWGGLEGAKWNVSVASGVDSLNDVYNGTSNPDGVVVFGYSQGATVASIFKSQLAAENGGLLPDGVSFVLIGNPNRPNGGLFERPAILGTVPILDATFGQPTPTDTAPAGDPANTTDIAFQYDGVADFPAVPWNLLAVANALAGFWYVHGTYLDPRVRIGEDDPTGTLAYGYTPEDIEHAVETCVSGGPDGSCQRYGDTVYVTLPATSLPLMQLFVDLGTSTGTSALVNPVVALLQPATQTLIETGYDRSNYGLPTPFQLIPRVDPVKFVSDLVGDIPQGINAAVATIQDPDHNIPDLPPTWDTNVKPGGPTTASILAAENNEKLAPKTELPTLELPKLKLSKLELAPKDVKLFKSRSAEKADTAEEATKPERPKLRDFHPVRDLVTEVKKTLPKPSGIEKAVSRLSGKKEAAQPAA